MNTPAEAPKKKSGFTLIELVITIVVVSIVAVSIVTRFNDDALKLDAIAQRVASDIRLMRSLSMSTGYYHGLRAYFGTRTGTNNEYYLIYEAWQYSPSYVGCIPYYFETGRPNRDYLKDFPNFDLLTWDTNGQSVQYTDADPNFGPGHPNQDCPGVFLFFNSSGQPGYLRLENIIHGESASTSAGSFMLYDCVKEIEISKTGVSVKKKISIIPNTGEVKIENVVG